MRRAFQLCRQGHVHPHAVSAATCDAAWRHVYRRRNGVDVLVQELRAVLARSNERNATRGV